MMSGGCTNRHENGKVILGPAGHTLRAWPAVKKKAEYCYAISSWTPPVGRKPAMETRVGLTVLNFQLL